MGTKRPYDDELQHFMKHPKHLDCGNKALFSEDKLPYDASQNATIPGEAGCMFYSNIHHSDGLESENASAASDLADKELDTSAPVPLVHNASGDSDTGLGAMLCPSLFPEYFEYNFPRRALVHFDDTFSSLVNSSPRKEVPLGPDHQADIPELESEVVKDQTLRSETNVGNVDGDRLVGVCVIPMPRSDLSVENGETASDCLDCNCLDSGSIRCVQQHVKEARAKLRETLGDDKFLDLGFYDIGEEVAHMWTEEEEQLFHEVVYSNPVSRGKNFWEHLATAFPARTKKELVSYYFNVFMLRRRAVQNRSKFLDADSDDDEWRGPPIRARGDEDDFVVGSFDDHDVQVDHGDDSSADDDDDDDVDADNGCGGDMIIGMTDGIEKEGVEYDFKEDSHASVEDKQQIGERETVIPENNEKSGKEKCLHGNCDGELGSEFVLEHCDAKVWDSAPYSMGTKSVDLISTCSMIEEIFGPSRNDKSIS